MAWMAGVPPTLRAWFVEVKQMRYSHTGIVIPGPCVLGDPTPATRVAVTTPTGVFR